MSTQTMTKKRKSADGSETSTKKIKVAKSAEKPAPVKSALKKEPAASTATMKTKAKARPVVEAHEVKSLKPSVKDVKPVKKSEKKKEKVVIRDNDEEDGGTTLTPDQTASLLAGFSSESEDDGEDDKADIPTPKLPKAPTTGEIQDRIAAATKASKKNSGKDEDPETTPGIIYVGRIPHGFHEPQMRAYFAQFGTITHLKLARNRKTGKSKHFAFIEFSSSVVADIVAKTMDKYLLFGHLLQVRRVASESVGDGMWVGEGRRGWNVRPNNKLERGHLRKGKTREEWEKKIGKEERKREAKKEKLREMGYEFDMPALKDVDAVPITEKAVGDATAAAAVVEPAEVVEAEETVVRKPEGDVVVEKSSTKKRTAQSKPKVKEARKVVKKVKTGA